MRRLAWSLLSIAIGACAAPPTTPPSAPAPAVVAALPTPPPLSEAVTEPDAPLPPPTLEARRFVEPIAPRAETRAVVLLYHSFGPNPDRRLNVKGSTLEQQLAALAEAHVEIVSTTELLDFLDGKIDLPARVAVITIDDGFRSVHDVAWPVFRERKARFTVGLVTGLMEEPKNAPVMTWDQVREMVDSGLCEVASHGHMHRALPAFSGQLMIEEIELSHDLIRKKIGRAPVAYFYPLGAYSIRAARELSKAGYRAAFRATGAPIAAGYGSRWWLPRMGLVQDDPPGLVARWFSPGFLKRASYIAKNDPLTLGVRRH